MRAATDDYQMTGKRGYFYLNIQGADGVNSRIKVQVDYSSKDEKASQKVKLTILDKGSVNNHNVKFSNGKKVWERAKTDRGSTTDISKAWVENKKPKQTDKNASGETIYSTDTCVVVQNIKFQYTKEAYTYETGKPTVTTGEQRINVRKYNWQGEGENTLSKKVYHQAQTEVFEFQINMANTGVYPCGNGTVYGEYTITLHHPVLEVSYDGNGATSGTINRTKIISYNSAADLHNFTTFSLEKTGYVRNDNAEWNTKRDGTGTPFDMSVSYYATDYKDFTDGTKFQTKSLTVYAQWRKNNYTITFHGNGATGGSMSNQVCDYGVGYYLTANAYTRTGYTFTGWNTAANGSGVSYGNGQAVQDVGNITLYAQWRKNNYTITFHGNGATGGSMSNQVCDYGVGYYLTANAYTRTGYTFTGWNTAANGSGVSYGDGQAVQDIGDITLYAQWRINSYNVTLHAGEGIASVSGSGKYTFGTRVSITATLKEGYHFENWTGTYQTAVLNYSFLMPAQDVTMTANAEANQYTIHFHPNDGAELSHVDDIVAEYGQEITLPNIITSDGTAAYVKYTLDGENVTEGVLSGAIPESMMYGYVAPEEAETEQPEDGTEASGDERPEEAETERPEEETEASEDEQPESKEKAAGTEQPEEETETDPQPTVYPSVFLGWALEENKDRPTAQWAAGDTVKNLVIEHGGEITLYAVWDDCPWIVAEDLYYSLEQAQSGFITEAEILSHATASDREDGSPIDPGFHENGTSFSIPDYRAEDFTGLTANPEKAETFEITETLTVVDSSGSMYSKEITVYVVDTTPQDVKTEGTTRFIDEYFYNQPYENGGLEDNSIWKTDPEYVETITQTFENLKNDTPVMEFHFTHEDVLKAKEYIQEHGIGNSKEPDALSNFYDTFMEPNRTK